MSEDEDCDDLPMIKVNSSASDSITFAMPSAEELATQRARELACEEELLRLRERADADERGAATAAALLAHSDSSGSEGELLAGALAGALHVQARAAPASAAALWAALQPTAPALLPPLQAQPRRALAAAVAAVAAALAASEPGAWPAGELPAACALLVTAVLAHESRSCRAGARALHALLDEHATAAQVAALGGALMAALPEARARLQLSDALRSGGGAGADRLSGELARGALLELLAPGAACEPSLEGVARAAAAWRERDAAARYACVQLAGRVLAARASVGEERAARAALLAHLAPPAAASGAQRPDRLKVLVGASKLRLLFRAEQ